MTLSFYGYKTVAMDSVMKSVVWEWAHTLHSSSKEKWKTLFMSRLKNDREENEEKE